MYMYFATLCVLCLVAGVEQLVNDAFHCQPVTSCSNRCKIEKDERQHNDSGASAFVIPSYTCFCDPLCRLYGDCCIDYDNICATNGVKVKEIQMQVAKTTHGGHQQKLETDQQLDETSHDRPITVRSMFECITIKEYPHRPFWATKKCQPSWINSEVSKLCSNITEADLLSRLPVHCDDGLTYRNVFCAQCNGRANVTFWNTEARCRSVPPDNVTIDPYALALYLKEDCVTFFTTERESPPRYCLNVESTCDHSKLDATKNFTKLSRACVENYQSPVIGHQDGNSTQIFKNSFCAECNGIGISREYCPSSRNTEIGNFEEYNYFINDKFNYDYSVITNFNTRDSDHVVIMYRSSGNVVPVEIQCPDGKVYDPYAEACREIYCGQSYMLLGDECVEDHRPREDIFKCSTSDDFPTISNDTIETNATDVTFRLTIVVRFEIKSYEPNTKFEYLINLPLLEDNFNISILNITIDNENVHHIGEHLKNSSTNSTILQFTKANVTVSGTAIARVAITYVTAAKQEDLDIAKNLATIISSLMHLVDIYDVTIYVDSTEIELPNTKQKVGYNVELASLQEFNRFLYECQTGVVRVYCADEVTYMPHDSCVSVFVNSTATEYSCAHSYIYSKENVSNSSQQNDTVFVCDEDYQMDDSCRRVRYNGTEYTVTDDGSVHIADGSIYEKGDYIKVGDQIEVCTEFDKVQEVYYVIFFDFNDVQKCIAFICISISMSGLILTIVTYALISELRTLPGQCILCLASTTLASQLIFLFGINITEDSIMCKTFAVLLHYLFLSSSLWTNVMAYDVYKTFGRKQISLRQQRPESRLLKYCIYAWGIPLGIILVCVTLYFSNLGLLGYGTHYSCWISRPLGFLIAFLVPLMFIILVNFVLFAKTVYAMRINRQSMHLHRDSRSMPSDRSELTIYIKMSTVMGFAWVFGCISAFTDTDALWYFFIIFNGLQGLFIYVSFACNARVRKLIRNKYVKYRQTQHALTNSPKRKVRVSESVQSTTISMSLTENDIEMKVLGNSTSLNENFDLQPSHISNC